MEYLADEELTDLLKNQNHLEVNFVLKQRILRLDHF